MIVDLKTIWLNADNVPLNDFSIFYFTQKNCIQLVFIQGWYKFYSNYLYQ